MAVLCYKVCFFHRGAAQKVIESRLNGLYFTLNLFYQSLSFYRLAELNVDYTVTLALACILTIKYVFFDTDTEVNQPDRASVISGQNIQPETSGELHFSYHLQHLVQLHVCINALYMGYQPSRSA